MSRERRFNLQNFEALTRFYDFAGRSLIDKVSADMLNWASSYGDLARGHNYIAYSRYRIRLPDLVLKEKFVPSIISLISVAVVHPISLR